MSILVNGKEHNTQRVYVASHVFGNTPEELEAAALDEARAFFGKEPQLVVSQTYIATFIPAGSVLSQKTDKKYVTTISVYEVIS